MNKKQVLHELERCGSAQTRKTYARHGVKEEMYGVSYADLGRLKKTLGTQHDLAVELWGTRIHDARVLATMIADAQAMKVGTVEAWGKELSNYVVTGAFSQLVARGPHRRSRIEKWTKSKKEWIGTAGWDLVGSLASSEEDVEDSRFLDQLQRIESRIHGEKNRVKAAMNMALICIGTRNPALTKAAKAAAKRIGKVDVDHGETACKTPDAIGYIDKTLAHRKTMRRKKA